MDAGTTTGREEAGVSDSGRERRAQCQRCGKWREDVRAETEYACSECRLRERCADLEGEVAALREQMAESEPPLAKPDEPVVSLPTRVEAAIDTVRCECERLVCRLNDLRADNRHVVEQARLAEVERDTAQGECERLKGQVDTLNGAVDTLRQLREFDAKTLAEVRALLHECREWLMAGGPGGRKLGYIDFRQRLDAALGDGPTYPYDERPSTEARES